MKPPINSSILYIVLLSSCWGCARKSAPIQQKEMVFSSAKVSAGQQHFMRFCNKCHPGGQAGLGPTINGSPAPHFLKRTQVRLGLGAMPAFSKKVISKQELDELIAYLKAMKRF